MDSTVGACQRVVVVGGGHAGGVFVLTLRRLGFEGTVTVLADEVDYPYERPSLSKAMLQGNGGEPLYLADVARWSDLCDLRLGTCVGAVDRTERRIQTTDGTLLPYDVLVLATGATPRKLPFAAHPKIYPIRTAADARAVRHHVRSARSIVIVGGGVIGLEVAASLRSVGLDVEVIEAGPRLLGRNVPSDAARWISDLHAKQGVRVRLGQAITDISPADERLELIVGGERLAPDLAVIGIGVSPRTELADVAGLSCDDGVLVNASYASLSDSHIYAIGDVAARADVNRPKRQETWAHAQGSAAQAARAILGLKLEPEEAPWFWTEHFGHVVQVAGQPNEAQETVARGEHTLLYLRCGAIIGAACLDAPRDFAAARRLIASGTKIDMKRACEPGLDLRKAVAA